MAASTMRGIAELGREPHLEGRHPVGLGVGHDLGGDPPHRRFVLQQGEREGEARERRLEAHPRGERQVLRDGDPRACGELGDGGGPQGPVEVVMEVGQAGAHGATYPGGPGGSGRAKLHSAPTIATWTSVGTPGAPP